MSQQSTDEIILRAAWKLLWTPGTNYYLPNVMQNGLNWNNIHIPPLEGSSVQDIGPVTLFKEPVLGYINLTMSSNRINGLPSINNQGFGYVDATHTLTLKIGFGQLNVSGHYEVDSGGVVGCAIGAANALLGTSLAMAMSGASTDNIDLAYQYRDKLSDPSNPNGNQLVNTYYDQNDTINSIVLAQNAVVNGKTNKSNGLFNYAWINYTTDGKDTAFYMNNTSDAAKNPDNTGTGFNDDNYNGHGFYMETILTIEANSLKQLGDPNGTALYDAIYGNAGNSSLNAEAQSYDGNSVNNFMGYVKEGGSSSLHADALKAVNLRKGPIYQKAYEKAHAFHEEWLANNRHEEYATDVNRFASLGDISQITGSFTDSFGLPALSITATVAMPGDTLVVTVTDLTATLPSLDVTLNPDHASSLNAKVQNAIANAGFMQNLMKTKIISGINSDDVKKYLSDRVNDAINKIFG